MSDIIFDKKVQTSLWKHMKRDSLIRVCSNQQYVDRGKTLDQLKYEVENGLYVPRPIHGFLTARKLNGVPRFIPVFTLEDSAVYFGCISAIDKELAEQAVPETFGGWRLGGQRRKTEEDFAKDLFLDHWSDEVSIPSSSYNRGAWAKNWQEFWKLLAVKAEVAGSDAHFVMFDIANFYDSINLLTLEQQIRDCCKGKGLAIEVLFFFLSTWNRSLTRYARSTQGIPQDLFGDCSRVLANFYLTGYDSAMRERALKRKSHFMRYADDMVFICPDKSTCEELLHIAATHLHSIGLNINCGKVRYFDNYQFHSWWGFNIINEFDNSDFADNHYNIAERRFDKVKFLRAIQKLQEQWNSPDYGRRITAFGRSLTIIDKYNSEESLDNCRDWILTTALNDPVILLTLRETQLQKLVRISADPIKTVTIIADKIIRSYCTEPKARLLRVFEMIKQQYPQHQSIANSFIALIHDHGDPLINLSIANTDIVNDDIHSKDDTMIKTNNIFSISNNQN